ncbi:RNA-binding S4 domain-containing protein [Stenotrophomonas sp. YIM B06876]|uniref:RNA-binding S4 domain-containing protein n=1 Tax=Stenotrophomonas sp. YIM B06876 TaxID=3060211 RepID=UPI002738371F|nr:RNA-binding S4 domain-containing protein [Stenotrophomonas sp. YIM B06876]
MQTIDFQLDRDYVELKQLLKLTDLVSSGGEAKTLIGDGQIRVDGEVELRKACKIRAGQQVRFGEVLIRVLEAGLDDADHDQDDED